MNTIIGFLLTLQEKVCEHLDYSDTMTGAVCNDCGKEEGEEA